MLDKIKPLRYGAKLLIQKKKNPKPIKLWKFKSNRTGL